MVELWQGVFGGEEGEDHQQQDHDDSTGVATLPSPPHHLALFSPKDSSHHLQDVIFDNDSSSECEDAYLSSLV